MVARTMLPIGALVGVAAAAAWVEYGQHSSLMLRTASADVAQLCADVSLKGMCPKQLLLSARPAQDPWGRPYRCRPTVPGVLIYTLGADGEVGGQRRDADIACVSINATSDMDNDERSAPAACGCGVGAEASALLR